MTRVERFAKAITVFPSCDKKLNPIPSSISEPSMTFHSLPGERSSSLILAAVAALALSGCGGSSSDSDSPSDIDKPNKPAGTGSELTVAAPSVTYPLPASRTPKTMRMTLYVGSLVTTLLPGFSAVSMTFGRERRTAIRARRQAAVRTAIWRIRSSMPRSGPQTCGMSSM